MAIQRVTQSMMTQRSLSSLHTNLNRLAAIQEQLSTGRVLNRPSDSPSGTTAAMRLRASLADTAQYGRNAADAVSWLGTIDSALSNANKQVQRARDLALQGANSGSMGPQAREALAAEVEQIRQGMIDTANATYLDRPVFGGITAGSRAFDANGLYVGTAGDVNRTVSEGVQLRVDVDGQDVFGVDGDNVFDHLGALVTALRGNDQAGIQASIDVLKADGDRIVNVQAEAGVRQARASAAVDAVVDKELSLKNSLSEVENADLPQTIVDLQMQQVAYQAALGATARVMQPSLLDFLR